MRNHRLDTSLRIETKQEIFLFMASERLHKFGWIMPEDRQWVTERAIDSAGVSMCFANINHPVFNTRLI